MFLARVALLLPLAGLTACTPPEVTAPAAEEPAVVSIPALAEAVVEVREAVQDVAPAQPAPEPGNTAFTDCAVPLIVRWEVGSPAAYARKWSGVYYPGGESGPTWGIGYDGGHQTSRDIRDTWVAHPDVGRLATTSGVTGSVARARIAEWRGIVVPYSLAIHVFGDVSLPSYTTQARRAFGPAFETAPVEVRCALASLVYNRGGQTTGPRRAEIRTIRDECLPGPDPKTCTSNQLLAMRRLWPDTPGLQNRRTDEARTARG